MEQQFCQSCGMPLTDENRGTNADGSNSEDYCVYCYKKGEFTQDFTMSQMIEFCLQFLDQWNVQTECKLSPVQAKEQMLQHFPYLKRWKEKDERTLPQKLQGRRRMGIFRPAGAVVDPLQRTDL